jgi:hypothetical protein
MNPLDRVLRTLPRRNSIEPVRQAFCPPLVLSFVTPFVDSIARKAAYHSN